MEKSEFYQLIPMDEREISFIRGGSDSFDYTVAEYLGMGLGFLAKKLWKGFQAYSEYMYQMQSRTMVIYK